MHDDVGNDEGARAAFDSGRTVDDAVLQGIKDRLAHEDAAAVRAQSERIAEWLNERVDAQAAEDIDRIVGERVATLRKGKGWSQKELAERVGARLKKKNYDPSLVSRLEAGGRPVPLSEAMAIAAVFETDLYQLVERAPDEVTEYINHLVTNWMVALARVGEARKSFLAAQFRIVDATKAFDEAAQLLHEFVGNDEALIRIAAAIYGPDFPEMHRDWQTKRARKSAPSRRLKKS